MTTRRDLGGALVSLPTGRFAWGKPRPIDPLSTALVAERVDHHTYKR
ncbi:hypothetical protein [Halovivax ruber]|nr:hypothetical protein [Halovivax ruber]